MRHPKMYNFGSFFERFSSRFESFLEHFRSFSQHFRSFSQHFLRLFGFVDVATLFSASSSTNQSKFNQATGGGAGAFGSGNGDSGGQVNYLGISTFATGGQDAPKTIGLPFGPGGGGERANPGRPPRKQNPDAGSYAGQLRVR